MTHQPLGIYPLPAGYLLLPPGEETEAIQSALMRGQQPERWPVGLNFYREALNGNIDAAYEALNGDDDLTTRYNRFVLRSSPDDYTALRNDLNGELRPLLDVVAYTLGYIPTPPESNGTQGERLALILMAQATHAIEQEAYERAIFLLEEAIRAARPVSPIFAAQLIGTLAETKYIYNGPSPLLIQQYKAAIKILELTTLSQTRSEMWLNLGILYHDLANGRRGPLLEAVKCYQQALAFFSRDDHPEPYALAQNNLALAYLSMPLQEAGDQLRMGIAVQSLREALKIYTRDTHPEQWASTQLNLANAYQYLPSTHPEENLIQAVELYEEVLAARNPAADPIGYARVLANQGNALAHLGIFVHAISKLEEATIIFEQRGEADAAASTAGLLEQVKQQAKGQNGTSPTPTI